MPLRSLLRSPWIPALGTGLAAAGLLLGSGTTGRNLVLFFTYVLTCVAFPGVFAWRALLWRLHTTGDRSPTWLEDLSLGSIFGFGLQLPFFLFGVAIGFPRLIVAIPLVVLALSVTPWGRRVWQLPNTSVDFRVVWVMAGTTVYAICWLAFYVFPSRPMWLPANHTPSIDETFHQALIADIAHRFPPQLPFMLGTPIDYHWFVHAQYAAARWITGVDSVAMLRQLGPVLFLLLIVPGLTSAAFRLTERISTSVLAPVILVAGGFHSFGPSYNVSVYTEPFLSIRYMSSPSQAYGFMMVLPVLYLAFEVLRPGARSSRWTWLALFLAMLALTGSKATFLPIFLLAALAMWLFQLVMNRRIDWSATAFVGVLVICTAFAQFVLFGGQTGGFQFHPGETSATFLHFLNVSYQGAHQWIVIGTLVLLIGWLLYGIGVLGLLRKRAWRDPRAVWLIVSVPVGILPAIVFFRTGLSQMWFQRSAAEMVVLLSVWGLGNVLPRPLPRRQGWIYAATAAGVGLCAFLIGWLVVDGAGRKLGLLVTIAVPLSIVSAFVIWWAFSHAFARLRSPTLALFIVAVLGLGLSNVLNLTYHVTIGPPHKPRHFPELFAPGGVPAADFIRQHSNIHAVVATNVHCAQPHTARCDNRSFWIAAYTERRIVLEGWGYSSVTNAHFIPGQANRFIPTPYPQRMAINDAAFLDPSPASVSALVDTYGVDWLFVDKQYPADVAGLDALTSQLTKVFENDNYVVYRVIH